MANGPSDTPTPSRTGTGLKLPKEPSKMPSKEHRIEIKDADAVQEQLLEGAHFLEDNAKVIIALIAIAILAGLAYAAWQGVTLHQERVAQEEYYKVEAPFMKAREAFEKDKFKSFMPNDPNDKSPTQTATGDITKDYGPLLTDLERVAHDAAGTAAGGQAAILSAQTYLDYKNPDKAIELAQLPATKLPQDHTLSVLGKILWGNALSAKGDCPAALGVWQRVLDTKSAEFLAADVNVRMGSCLEKIGQNDRAAEAYRTASKSDSPAGQSAKGLLRAVELKAAVVSAAPPVPKEK